MRRSMKVWLAGPLVMVLLTAAISLAARSAGDRAPVIVLFSPPIAFAVAWIAWWPILRPNIGFWLHTAIGVLFSALVLAIEVTLSGR